MTTATRPRIKIRIHPLEDRVVIRPADEVETRRGPLYIPDTAREKPTQGEILAAGPGRLDKTGKRLPMDVKYTGTPYEASGDELIIIKASEILAVIG
jgi:chaperonin GroES